MEEVELTILNKTEIIILDTLEHEFLSSGDDSLLLLMRLAQCITCGLILGTNLPLIIFTVNQKSKTFLDWLIILDCILCLFNLRAVILLRNYFDYDAVFCVCHVFFSFFTTLCNRLLSLGIVLYRFTLVLGSSFVFSSNQKKVLENIILLAILLPSLNLTAWAIYYKEDNRYFLSKVKHVVKIFISILYYLCFNCSVYGKKSRVFLQFY